MKLEQVTLSSTSGGPLSSSWTANSQYMVKSAYLAHFNGSVEHYKRNILWKARSEEKCRFFACTVIQNKIIMAKNLGVTSKFVSLCDLCNGPLKTITHTLLAWPFRLDGVTPSSLLTTIHFEQHITTK